MTDPCGNTQNAGFPNLKRFHQRSGAILMKTRLPFAVIRFRLKFSHHFLLFCPGTVGIDLNCSPDASEFLLISICSWELFSFAVCTWLDTVDFNLFFSFKFCAFTKFVGGITETFTWNSHPWTDVTRRFVVFFHGYFLASLLHYVGVFCRALLFRWWHFCAENNDLFWRPDDWSSCGCCCANHGGESENVWVFRFYSMGIWWLLGFRRSFVK